MQLRVIYRNTSRRIPTVNTLPCIRSLQKAYELLQRINTYVVPHPHIIFLPKHLYKYDEIFFRYAISFESFEATNCIFYTTSSLLINIVHITAFLTRKILHNRIPISMNKMALYNAYKWIHHSETTSKPSPLHLEFLKFIWNSIIAYRLVYYVYWNFFSKEV